MSDRPFHHGNLRAVLLEEAESVLRESGVDGMSLRELARRAGVSHGAPRSHFIDRQALLDALAQTGFERLTSLVSQAIDGAEGLDDRFRRVAHAYVDFAIDDAALMDLMFQAKTDRTPGTVHQAATRLFATLDGAMDGSAGGSSEPPDPVSRDAFKMLFAATMQGIAALVASGRLERGHGDRLIDEAADMMLGSELAARSVADHGSVADHRSARS